ncbi:hypothetical protein XELAEV_18043917mg, partial [Xenopus laevis]
ISQVEEKEEDHLQEGEQHQEEPKENEEKQQVVQQQEEEQHLEQDEQLEGQQEQEEDVPAEQHRPTLRRRVTLRLQRIWVIYLITGFLFSYANAPCWLSCTL